MVKVLDKELETAKETSTRRDRSILVGVPKKITNRALLLLVSKVHLHLVITYALLSNASNIHLELSGQWDEWSDWGPCSATCGLAKRQRTRDCIGFDCQGEHTETQSCTDLPQCKIIFNFLGR